MSAALPQASGMGVVWRLGAATTLAVLGFAMTAPVLAVSLQQAGHGTAAVGAFAMAQFLTIGLLIPLMPRLLARWGVLRAYQAGSVLVLAAVSSYAFTQGLWAWTVAALLSGAGTAALWNGTEALLAREAPAAQRGKVMGLYQTSLGAALALGPFAPGVLGWGARPILMLGAFLTLLCCVIAFTISRKALHEGRPGTQSGIVRALRAVPGLAALAFTGGVFEAGLSAVSAAYASGTGMGLSAAASVAGAIGVGSFLCQYPAGMAADRFRPKAVFGAATALLLAASLAFALAARAPWLLWGVGVVWGGVGGALYTLTMVRVAHEFEGQATAGGAAAMITGYTLGGMVGPPASGAALQWGGPLGLAAGLSALAAFALAISLRQRATARA
ncbi:MAG TPA: MFS transporter [Ramlibacter sp.]|nr:MFS transporter [Ramlibacter sp.]